MRLSVTFNSVVWYVMVIILCVFFDFDGLLYFVVFGRWFIVTICVLVFVLSGCICWVSIVGICLNFLLVIWCGYVGVIVGWVMLLLFACGV